jgi:hypothetical protein
LVVALFMGAAGEGAGVFELAFAFTEVPPLPDRLRLSIDKPSDGVLTGAATSDGVGVWKTAG